jgi:UDP-N-acetylmuramate dehydrogenase
MTGLDKLRASVKGDVSENAELAPYSTFRIGGNARIYVEPIDIDDVIGVQRFAREANERLLVIGNGSNVLIADEGWDGVAVNLQKGLLSGIPATLGGAVRMNAGCYGGETSDHLTEVEVVRDLEAKWLSKAEATFSYRHSGFSGDDIIVAAKFSFPPGDPKVLRETKLKWLKHRNDSQPVNLPNCGSVFKNPRPRFSAELIESAGLKGTRIGGAEISEKHANFIVNTDNASANDVVQLMNLARKTVFESSGIVLEPEVQLIGFPSNPIEPLQ